MLNNNNAREADVCKIIQGADVGSFLTSLSGLTSTTAFMELADMNDNFENISKKKLRSVKIVRQYRDIRIPEGGEQRHGQNMESVNKESLHTQQ